MASKKVNLPIKGMACTSCAQTIEKNLKRKKGVHLANVNFASEKAYVDFDPKIISNKDLIEAVREVGYEVILKTERLTLKVGGMSRASCAQTIEKALKKTEGILGVNVNFAAERAAIFYDSSQITPEEIRQLIEETGYQVRSREEAKEEGVDEEEQKMTETRRRMLWTWGFTVPIIA